MATGGGLSKIGTTLIIIFAISLLALLAELIYVLWRRRLFHRRTNSITGDGDEASASHHSPSESSFSSSVASSKDLLYFFFCVRPPQFRNADTVIDIDLLKINGAFGPPRFLFTIKEEEKEEIASPAADKSLFRVNEIGGKIEEDIGGCFRVSLEEHFKAAAAGVEEAVEIGDLETTPFSTPCGSPVYFTPSASPVHEEGLIT